MVKHTQTIRGVTGNKLFEYIWPFCEVNAWRFKKLTDRYINLSFSEEGFKDFLKNLKNLLEVAKQPHGAKFNCGHISKWTKTIQN